MTIDRLRAIAEGPALDLPAVTWEAPEIVDVLTHTFVVWEDEAPDVPTVFLNDRGTQHMGGPVIEVGEERLTLDQAEAVARHLLSAVAMGREVQA